MPIFSERDYYVENYERISGDHLSHFERTGQNPFMNEDYWRSIEESTESLVRKYIGSKSVKILDVGVGMGRLLEKFPGNQRHGMDISLGYLIHAKNKGIEVCMSRIEDMPYKDSYFDIVVCTDVLEHVLDLNVAIAKILLSLKEDGVLIVRVPYKEDLGQYLHEDFPYDLVHLRSFDEHSLTILFEKIFRQKMIEYGLVGHTHGKLKIGGGIRYLGGVVRRILRLFRFIHSSVHIKLCNFIFQPTEINFVVCKFARPTRSISN